MTEPASATSFSPDEPICVVTRIGFERRRSLPGAIRRFRALRRVARKQIEGFVDAHLRVRRPATLVFVSIWRDERALVRFTTLDQHVEAVRWTIRRRGRVWSGLFRLSGTSSMSEQWIGTVRHWRPLASPHRESASLEVSRS